MSKVCDCACAETPPKVGCGVEAVLDTPAGAVPVVSTAISLSDMVGTWRVRCAIGRGSYRVTPGLYAVGHPDEKSEVLVTANYKMTFDRLRGELAGRDLWILVLDTDGINVWCAAGKGTFGTEELVARISAAKLELVVSHRRVILPQLGASGVASHEARKASGFKVVFGPVRASDIGEFLDAGMKTTPAMRRVTFGLHDRLVLTPVEFVIAGKYLLPAMVIALLASVVSEDGLDAGRLVGIGLPITSAIFMGWVAGAVLGPALLPWLPFRSFSGKGAASGALLSLLFVMPLLDWPMFLVSCILLTVSISSFLTMNFTGASTYTSPSGVRREMKIWVPLQVVSLVVGCGLWVAHLFTV